MWDGRARGWGGENYFEDDVTADDAASYDEDATAEDEEQREFAPGYEVGFPEHRDRD